MAHARRFCWLRMRGTEDREVIYDMPTWLQPSLFPEDVQLFNAENKKWIRASWLDEVYESDKTDMPRCAEAPPMKDETDSSAVRCQLIEFRSLLNDLLNEANAMLCKVHAVDSKIAEKQRELR